LCETTIDHPGLARPLAFGTEGGIPYLVYADLAGTAMDAVMREHGPRPVAEVVQRLKQLADAIDVAAGAGVCHGMMAPGDVILDDERTAVTGFGFAQALIKAGIPAEAESPYGSPQRLAGAPPTPADDIYSLAAITLELLIGTPKDPEQEVRALREAQGLPERRRIQRPAPHETRVFTTIAGVDAGKLRAAFAAAFTEDRSARPSTAAAFVASFQDAFAKRETDEPAPKEMAGADTKREEDEVTLEPPVREEPVVAQGREEPVVAEGRAEPVVAEGRAARRRRARARRREKLATTQPPAPEASARQPREDPADRPVARPEPIADVEFFEEVTPPGARSIEQASLAIPAQSGSRGLLVAGVVAVGLASLATGFAGGFVLGQRSSPSTGSTAGSDRGSVAGAQSARTAVEKAAPTASTTQLAAPVTWRPPAPGPSDAPARWGPPSGGPSEAKGSSEESIAATKQTVASMSSEEASGRLLVRSTPAGAGVAVDGQSRGVTPLALRELAFGAHTIEVSHPGHDTRRQRVTLSERRPARSIDVALRPTSEPAPATASTNETGSLQVASRPSGAQVFVDDYLIGTTPLLLPNIATGSKRLRIELSGYQSWTTSIQIEPSARRRVSASLEP
jgi:serine/threonine-protein kinase